MPKKTTKIKEIETDEQRSLREAQDARERHEYDLRKKKDQRRENILDTTKGILCIGLLVGAVIAVGCGGYNIVMTQFVETPYTRTVVAKYEAPGQTLTGSYLLLNDSYIYSVNHEIYYAVSNGSIVYISRDYKVHLVPYLG